MTEGSGEDSFDSEGDVAAAGWMSLAKVYAAAYTAEEKHNVVSLMVQRIGQSERVDEKGVAEMRRYDTQRCLETMLSCTAAYVLYAVKSR